ncbi:MAG: hypothetical protein V3575_05520 [Candidatus Absconditabacteria bacterium]
MKNFENKLNNEVYINGRRKFCKNCSILLISLLSLKIPIGKVYALSDIPSAVKHDDFRIQLAYKYFCNLEDASIFGFSNLDYVKILLGLEKSEKVDKNIIIERGSPLSLTSPIYAILVAKLGYPLTQEEISKGETLGNKHMGNLVKGINLISVDDCDYIQARNMFLKNVLEIAKLDSVDYNKISCYVKKQIDENNIVEEFCSLDLNYKAWIFDNVLDTKFDNKYLPNEKYLGHFYGIESMKDPSQELKNYYFSMCLYNVAEAYIINFGNKYFGRIYRFKIGYYNKLQDRFGYDPRDLPILYGPIEFKK